MTVNTIFAVFIRKPHKTFKLLLINILIKTKDVPQSSSLRKYYGLKMKVMKGVCFIAIYYKSSILHKRMSFTFTLSFNTLLYYILKIARAGLRTILEIENYNLSLIFCRY